MSSRGCGGSLTWRRSGSMTFSTVVRPRVALGEEPLAAAHPVLPPLALDAGDVVAEIDVVGQLTERRLALRARGHLAEVRVLVDRTRTAVRARKQKRHSVTRRVTRIR